jgi:hypothetical protein
MYEYCRGKYCVVEAFILFVYPNQYPILSIPCQILKILSPLPRRTQQHFSDTLMLMLRIEERPYVFLE